MAALDFPSNPTVGQQYAAPNGVTYQWDGAAWVVTGGPPGQLWTGAGATLTPTDATKRVVIPGPTGGGADQSQLQLGTRTQKGRLELQPGADWYGALLNLSFDGTTWHADDSTKPCWQWNFYNDFFTILRSAGSTPGTTATFLAIDNTGRLIVPGSTASGADQSQLVCGTRTQKGRLASLAGFDHVALSKNRLFDGAAWQRDDTSQPGWVCSLSQGDNYVISRMSAAGADSNLLTLDNAGNLTISGATATKASGTTWANPSDRRLKDEITDYATGLAAILGLLPRTFVYNGKAGSQTGLRGYGFIADEVEPVMPEMVGTTQARLNTDDEEETEIQTLDTSNLILALVNAVKELATRLATLEAHA